MAIDVDTLRRILRVSSPEARMICWLILNGHNQAEIAEKLEITTRAVEGHMHRLRKRVEKMVARGAIQTRHQLQDSQATEHTLRQRVAPDSGASATSRVSV
ncbi:MAG: sigma-70 region 4 domain-containing protein [Pseudonocardia sp.]|nr:sigma-70 region 4 domain-containing protein [Pseudonocardia sp.]